MPEKTANYKLNQWKKEDDFLMKDFNDDNAAIEAALTGLKSTVDGKAAQSEVDTLKTTVSAKANQSDLTSLTTTVNGKVGIVTGTYTGDGAASRDIYLGFQPKAVLLTTKQGDTTSGTLTRGGLALLGAPLYDLELQVALEITATGFRVFKGNKNETNDRAYFFHYLAFV